jgi:hypothetical protein
MEIPAHPRRDILFRLHGSKCLFLAKAAADADMLVGPSLTQLRRRLCVAVEAVVGLSTRILLIHPCAILCN